MIQAAEILGDFQLVRELGRGGMGVVHLARQKSLGRLVALKLLPREFTVDSVRLERFHREAEVISRLDHPSIVPVYAVGESNGNHYIAMKYLDGETLDRVIRARSPVLPASDDDRPISEDTLVLAGGPNSVAVAEAPLRFPPKAESCRPMAMESEPGWIHGALRIVEKVARALHHAHSRGVIHRDVKPANILIDWTGHPWLLDFGLVRDLANYSITATDNFLGTAWYMAPEQVKHGGTADARSDVYSLGVTLYEMLTLRRPFDYQSPDTLFHAIVNEDPIPPRRFNARLPRDLETVVLKSIAKDPEERYASADAFAEDLRRVRGFEPVIARKEALFGRARRWVQRNPALAGASLFAVLSFVGMIESSVYRDLLEERRARAALAAADTAFEDGEFHEALANYNLYLVLGGDREVVGPRLLTVRRIVKAHPAKDLAQTGAPVPPKKD